MKKNTFILVIVCAISMIFTTIFTACNGDANDADTSGEPKNASENEVTETTENGYYKNIPEGLNYGGYIFTVLMWDPAERGWNPYLDVEEMNGDILNDEAYKRNREVSEILGVEFAFVYVDPWGSPALPDKIYRDIAAGDCPYDVFMPWPGQPQNMKLIKENLLHDWNHVPYMDLAADWYRHSANETLTIAGKTYFCTSDMLYPSYGLGSSPILFNKELCTILGLEFPYQLVYDGNWTYDVFCEYTKNIYSDLNNNGKKDINDRYGYVDHVGVIAFPFMFWDEPPVMEDKNGFVMNIFSDRIADMVGKVSEFAKSQDVFWNEEGFFSDKGVRTNFMNGNSLFTQWTNDPMYLRSVEFDFGYLPFPKYDGKQKDYYFVSDSAHMGIPSIKTEENVERTGAIVEALSAGGKKYVVDAYIRMTVENKILRDEDSVNIFRMMRSNERLVGNKSAMLGVPINNEYYTPIFKDGAANLASHYEKHSQRLTQILNDLYESIVNNR